MRYKHRQTQRQCNLASNKDDLALSNLLRDRAGTSIANLLNGNMANIMPPL